MLKELLNKIFGAIIKYGIWFSNLKALFQKPMATLNINIS
jgi:hypothetical protein